MKARNIIQSKREKKYKIAPILSSNVHTKCAHTKLLNVHTKRAHTKPLNVCVSAGDIQGLRTSQRLEWDLGPLSYFRRANKKICVRHGKRKVIFNAPNDKLFYIVDSVPAKNKTCEIRHHFSSSKKWRHIEFDYFCGIKSKWNQHVSVMHALKYMFNFGKKYIIFE